MSQPRVYEFAKEIGIETLILMDKLREWDIHVKSHMALLDDETVTLIKSRLSEEGKTTEVVKKKKVAKKKTADKKKEVVAKDTVEKVAKAGKKKTKTVAKKMSQRTVLRRKANEIPSALEAKEIEDQLLPQDFIEGSEETASVASENQSAVTQEETSSAGAVAKSSRQNIVGKMDLKRVKELKPQTHSSGSISSGTSISAGGSRGIRTGFVIAPLDPFMSQEFEDRKKRQEEEDLEKERKKKAKAEETSQAHFSATEFRKREVVFQPKKKKSPTREAKRTQITTPKAHKRVIKIENTIKLGTLAQEMGIKATQLVSKLMKEGMTVNINSDLDYDTTAILAPEYGFEVQNVFQTAEDILKESQILENESDLQIRTPVVTVMGHVDHGKTSLLDSIRKSGVVDKEAGGITQHIGAYKVDLEDGKSVTFIDTPGHEAFTAMRARGANVTDIVILVVAADDGVMPQTVEALNHAKSAGVPIIVAVNKIDKPAANPEKIKQQLSEHELLPEEWGGTTIFQNVSALKKEGIKELLEQVLLVAEVQEIKANPSRAASGIVIESRMDKGRGVVATLLVKNGTLKGSDIVVAGTSSGRVRSMQNEKGQKLSEVLPGEPVEILGLDKIPHAGDSFDVVANEKIAEDVVKKRQEIENQLSDTPNSKMSLESIFSKIQEGQFKELPVILKTDVAGSAEAVKSLLDKTSTDEVKVKILHSAVGGITESDVLLARTSHGLILGFNVRPDSGAQSMAKQYDIEIKTYNVIYELVDDIKKALSGLLDPEYKDNTLGQAEVRQTFVVPKIGTIAGCMVKDGKVTRNALVRLIREGRVIYEGKLSSLKRFKDDAREVLAGFECGIGIENYNDLKSGDVIEAYERQVIERSL